MKRKKEFLEGVYKKAEEIESFNSVHEKKKNFSINLKTAVAAAAVIALIPFSIRVLNSEGNSSRNITPEGYSMMETEEKGPVTESAEIGTKAFEYDELKNMISNSSLIANGEVTSIEGDAVYIKVSSIIKGKASKDIISIFNVEDLALLPSQEVLVFLKEGGTSDYLLTEGSKSLFNFYTVQDNNKSFKSLEGYEITLEELDNLIHGG